MSFISTHCVACHLGQHTPGKPRMPSMHLNAPSLHPHCTLIAPLWIPVIPIALEWRIGFGGAISFNHNPQEQKTINGAMMSKKRAINERLLVLLVVAMRGCAVKGSEPLTRTNRTSFCPLFRDSSCICNSAMPFQDSGASHDMVMDIEGVAVRASGGLVLMCKVTRPRLRP